MDALKAKCQPQENVYCTNNSSFYLGKVIKETFSDLYQEVCHICDIYSFEEEGRCCDYKDCDACKKSARDIRITDILTLAVRDNDLGTEFRKLKGRNQTETRFHQEGTNWDIDNATKNMYIATETVTQESIHAVSFDKKSNNIIKKDCKQSKDKFFKLCEYC